MVHRLSWLRTITVVLSLVLSGGVVLDHPSAARAADCQFFPETGKQVCGPFLTYWQTHGGLARQGLPLSDAFQEVNSADGGTYLTQYFERARFEYHPENQPPYDVLLGLVGREQFAFRYPYQDPPHAFDSLGEGARCFPETNKCISEGMLAYWQAQGGLAQFGLPITHQFQEIDPATGATWRVAYFERARIEVHPENKAPYNFLLGLLGRDQFLMRYPSGQVTAAPQPPPAAPANRPKLSMFPGAGPSGTTFTLNGSGFPPGAEITAIIVWYVYGLDRATYRLAPGQTTLKLTFDTTNARADSFDIWLYADGRYMGMVTFTVR